MKIMKPSNKLQQTTDRAMIESFICNTKQDQRSVLAWKFVDGKKVTVKVYIRVIRLFKSEFVIKAKSSNDQQLFDDLTVGSQEINIFFPDDVVIFRTKIKSRDNYLKDITLGIPSSIALINRRKSLRYVIGDDKDVSIHFFKEKSVLFDSFQRFEKPSFDISTGGISFIVSRTEKKMFSGDDIIGNLEVEIADKRINVMAQVVNVYEINPDERNDFMYKSYKVSLKFLSLLEEDKDIIDSYILEKISLNKDVS
ncbi:MAG: PilZ domain-containing protein [Bacteriovoracaceae bacterium]|nr:PilZ domain-containing protein [Bacteriovoracaceae bacterium]